MLYKIKDLGVGYGVFVKIAAAVELKDNMLINVGESYIVVNLLQKDTLPQTTAAADNMGADKVD